MVIRMYILSDIPIWTNTVFFTVLSKYIYLALQNIVCKLELQYLVIINLNLNILKYELGVPIVAQWVKNPS